MDAPNNLTLSILHLAKWSLCHLLLMAYWRDLAETMNTCAEPSMAGTGTIMKILLGIALTCALAGCSTYQAHSNLATPYVPTNASQVQILYSPPQRAYTAIGV